MLTPNCTLFLHLFNLRSVQYRVLEDKVPSAYYKLTDNRRQIMSYVFDVIRGSVPRMELDEAFESKDHIANAVKDQLSIAMAEYGYEIVATLVVDLDPSDHVKAAMNDINGKPFMFFVREGNVKTTGLCTNPFHQLKCIHWYFFSQPPCACVRRPPTKRTPRRFCK